MRVLLSGGTGFLGRAIGHALVARGDEIVVLTRGPAGALEHACAECGAGGKVALVHWSPDEPGDWMEAVEGADAVVHLAGAAVIDHRWTDERKAVLRSSRVTPTRLLAEAIARTKRKPKVFVTASGIGHYGTRTGDAIVTEADPPGDDFLARLTVEWEGATRAAADAGVRVCHSRSGVVLGHDGGYYGKLAPIFRGFAGGPIGDGTQYVPWVHIRDAARAVEAFVDRAELSGAYNVVAPEPVTMNEFAQTLGDSLHRPSILRVPAFAMRAALGAEAAEAILTGQRATPKRLVDAGFAFVFPDLRSALGDLAQRA